MLRLTRFKQKPWCRFMLFVRISIRDINNRKGNAANFKKWPKNLIFSTLSINSRANVPQKTKVYLFCLIINPWATILLVISSSLYSSRTWSDCLPFYGVFLRIARLSWCLWGTCNKSTPNFVKEIYSYLNAEISSGICSKHQYKL